MPEISDDDLGLLAWCAMSYDRRLPHGLVPGDVWKALSDEWRGKINRWQSSATDVIGAEVRPHDCD